MWAVLKVCNCQGVHVLSTELTQFSVYMIVFVCFPGYDCMLYRQYLFHSTDANAPYINTQICEQENSVLAWLRTPAAFMTQERFLTYVRYEHNRQGKE